MEEKWTKWASNPIPNGNYELMEICQNWDGLRLVFCNNKRRIVVVYKEEILAFRSCDEGDRWKTVDEVLAMNGKEFFKDNLFFRVNNSEFKKWFCQENFGVREESEFDHHAFVTANDIVDVLALHVPEIKIESLSD